MFERFFRRSRVVARLRRNVLSESLSDLVVYLGNRGHPLTTIHRYTEACEHFGHWLRRKRISPSEVDEHTVNLFLHGHLPKCRCRSVPSPRHLLTVRAALRNLLVVIQRRAVASSPAACRQTLIDEAVEAFQIHMEKTCGLATATCVYRTRYVREFLKFKYQNGPIRFADLQPGDLMRFVADRAKQCKAGTAQVIASSLRCYLRFLQLNGLCEESLIEAVPRIPKWKFAHLPPIMTEEQLRSFLSSFDRSTSRGLRDYAMALCLVELGLRAGEVAHLCLDDIDWRESTIRIVGGKTRRSRLLPLSKRLGRAITAYLRHGRPHTPERKLFLRYTVPLGTPIGPEMVRGAVRRAYARSGLDARWTGTHILRHTAATRIHQAGATLKEVADLLGHGCIDTTAIYTKVNFSLLATVALPWPEVKS